MRDDYDDDDRDGGGASDVILAFLLGGLTGAALALLYAPRTGQETRDLLGERLRETAERGREMKQEAWAAAAPSWTRRPATSRRGQTIEQRKERLAAAVDAGRQAFREERRRAAGRPLASAWMTSRSSSWA